MKKVFQISIIILVFVLGLTLVGCNNGGSVDQQTIISLMDALDDAQFRIEELEEQVSSLESSNKNLSKRVEDNKNKIAEVEKEKENQASGEINVFLADKYYLVVGDNFQLFYRSVIQAVDPYQYYLRVTGDAGHSYNRYFEFKPEKTGTYNLKIEVCDDNGNVFGSDSTKLIVAAKTTTATKTVLCIGDSLTSSGQWVAQGVKKFTAAGGNITTIGTINKTINSTAVKYEGRGGWQWSSYLTQYDASTPSPFLKSTGSGISFTEYIQKNKFSEPTEFYIMMTFNGLPGVFQEFNEDVTMIKQAHQLIDQIHADYPNAKISLMSLPLTSTKSGLGAYYSISAAYGDNYGKAVTVYNYDNYLEEWCKQDEYKSFMRYVDIKGQFDSENNMPSEAKAVNNNNTSVKEEVGNAMGMHPSTAGYEQIGDAFFRALMSNWG